MGRGATLTFAVFNFVGLATLAFITWGIRKELSLDFPPQNGKIWTERVSAHVYRLHTPFFIAAIARDGSGRLSLKAILKLLSIVQ